VPQAARGCRLRDRFASRLDAQAMRNFGAVAGAEPSERNGRDLAR
jgi:hypothetical protein